MLIHYNKLCVGVKLYYFPRRYSKSFVFFEFRVSLGFSFAENVVQVCVALENWFEEIKRENAKFRNRIEYFPSMRNFILFIFKSNQVKRKNI